MEQTKKYIEVLNWGYGGFAPMTLSPDYKASLEQAQQRLSLLDELDYNALLDEAIGKGKDYLERYTKTDDTFEYGLHFMRDGKILLDAIPTMFKCFKDGADKFKTDGLWTLGQWREYRVTLSQIEVGFEKRLKEFAAAYGYNLCGENQERQATSEPKHTKSMLQRKGRPKESLQNKVVGDDTGLIKKLHSLIDGKKGKDVYVFIVACIKLGKLTKPTYTQVINEFGYIGNKSGFYRYMNERLFTKIELEGAMNQINTP